MAQSKAVVTTSVGAEGIDATRGEEIVVADAPAEFADETVFLLQNPDLVQSIGAKARQLIEEKYDWRIIERDIHELYKKLSPNYLQFAFL